MKRISFVASLSFVLFFSFAAYGQEKLVDYEGRKAFGNCVLAKLRPQASQLSIKSLNENGAMKEIGLLVSERRFKMNSNLRVLEFSSLWATDAAGKEARFRSGEELDAALEELRASGLFEYVEPDWQVQPYQIPNDSAFRNGTLWGLANSGQDGGTSGVDVQAEAAWELGLGDPNLVVAVIDTGVRYTHRDLADNMWVNPGEIAGNGIDDDNNGYIDDVHGINAITGSGDPFDDDDHGTHVAGTIAAVANNNGSHVGVAPNCKIMALKFLGANGGSTADAITCIDYATDMGVKITNNSWGGGGFSQALEDSIAAAGAAGSLFVAAAGNDATNNDSIPAYPASYDLDNIISVAALDRNGELAIFSNFGSESVDIAAPGVEIFSSIASSNSSYDHFSGTSMASPHVAGVAALLLSQDPDSTIAETRLRLLQTSEPLSGLSGRIATGAIVQARSALGVAADGILEITVRSSGSVELLASTDFEVTVTDLLPVTGAVVQGTLNTTGATATFIDNGVGPDRNANDGIYTASIAVGDVDEITLTVSVSAEGKVSAEDDYVFPVLEQPDNDDFADRFICAPGTTSDVGTTALASMEIGESSPATTAGDNSVWWEWIPEESGNALISTEGSSVSTSLAIYIPRENLDSSVENLSPISIVAGEEGAQSSATILASVGQQYMIRVSGYQGEEGNLVLSYPPPSGTIANGLPYFTTRLPETSTSGFQNTLELFVAVEGGGPFTYQWFFNEEAIAGANEPLLSIPAATSANSGDYYVAVANDVGEIRSEITNVFIRSPGIGSPNDEFSNATELNRFVGSVTGNNSLAMGQFGEPDHADSGGEINSLWYEWVAPIAGTVKFNTLGSGFDTILAAYSGDSVRVLAELVSNDNALGLDSQIILEVEEGEQLMIVLDGAGDATGEFILNYEFSLLPTVDLKGNDLFQNRTDLGSVTELNLTQDAPPINSLWWTWEAPAKGDLVVSTAESSFDTLLAVYTGDNLSALVTRGRNDDIVPGEILQSEATLGVSQGRSYHIVVDGYGNETGDIRLSLSFVPDIAVEPRQLLQEAVEEAGLVGADQDPMASPFNNGLSNLAKYAFNLDLRTDDQSVLDEADLSDVSGLPILELTPNEQTGGQRASLIYIRNPTLGLDYTPRFSGDLQTDLLDSFDEDVLKLTSDGWERVHLIYEFPATQLKGFFWMEVSFREPEVPEE